MMLLTKSEIESLYFEYRKMEALMDLGVGYNLNGLFAHNTIANKYINSLLLIDLFSVVDNAINYVFNELKLKQKKKKSQLLMLIELGKVRNHEYLNWYKEWRNNAAHNFSRVESSHLRQAARDIQIQLLEWGIIDNRYDVMSYSSKTGDNEFHYGAYIDEIPILLFQNVFGEFHEGLPTRCTYGEIINLSLIDYRKLLEKKKS